MEMYFIICLLLNNFSTTFLELQSCGRLLLFRFKFLFIIILSISWPNLEKLFSALLRFVGRLRLNRDPTNIYPDHHQRGRPVPDSRECRPPALVAWSDLTSRLTGPICRSDTRNGRKVCNENKNNKNIVRGTVRGTVQRNKFLLCCLK